MYFEVIDNKFDCFGFFHDGLIDMLPPQEDIQSYCWTYNPVLKDHKNIDFVSLYCEGKTINEVCPEELQNDWKHLNERFKAFFRSFYLAKINMEENCFYDMVPMPFLVDYFSMKVKIIEHIVKTYPKPSNYDHMFEIMKVCETIGKQELNIDTSVLDVSTNNPMTKRAKMKYDNLSRFIKYDIFGTKTGRLSTSPRSFPILNMDKEYRNVIKPTNDWFLELDFNGAELRTFLALAGKPQPKYDIHDWNIENIFDGKVDREEAKKKIFAWLYGDNDNKKAEEIYNKQMIRDRFWDGNKITTYFGRQIEADKHHSLSYIVQSTFADLVLRQMVKVSKLLESKKSFISFTIHDNIIVDLADEEKSLLPQIVETFSSTELGKFLVNVKVGPNFGEMKKLNYKQTI